MLLLVRDPELELSYKVKTIFKKLNLLFIKHLLFSRNCLKFYIYYHYFIINYHNNWDYLHPVHKEQTCGSERQSNFFLRTYNRQEAESVLKSGSS